METVKVTPTPLKKSKSFWTGLILMPLGFIQPIRDFIAHNPELQPVISGLLLWFFRYLTKAPLTITK